MSGALPEDGGMDLPVDAGAMPTVFEARSDFEAQCVRGVLEDGDHVATGHRGALEHMHRGNRPVAQGAP